MQRALLMLGIVVVVAAVTSARPAAAGELRAHLDCTIGARPVVAGKKQVLDGHLTCALVIDDGYPEIDPSFPRDARAVAWLEQDGIDLSARRLLETSTLIGDPAVIYPLGTFQRTTDFARCADLTVHTQIASGDESIWEGQLAIGVSCKAAKKVKARLTCWRSTRWSTSSGARRSRAGPPSSSRPSPREASSRR